VQQEQNNVSCLNSLAIIDYVRRTHPDRMPDLLAAVPPPWTEIDPLEEYLCDVNNWISSSCVVALFEKAREIVGNDRAAFDIGYQSILHREFGYWQKILVRFFSTPRRILRRLDQLNARLNTTKVVELVSDSPWHAVVRWHWTEGVVASKDSCLYNQGIYSAIPTVWGRPAARVEERACRFDGHDYCEIHLSWAANWSLGGVLPRLFHRSRTAEAAIEEISRDKTLLKQRFDELSVANRELREKVMMLKEINGATRALASLTDPQMVLEQTMHTIVDVFGFDRAIIMLVDDAQQNLEFRYGVGESPALVAKLSGYRVPLDREQNLLIRVLKGKKPVRISDVQSAGLNPTNKILADFRPSSFILCPLIAENKAVGVLGADRRGSHARVSQTDGEFLSIFANSIGTVFLHARLDEELRMSNVHSVRALVQAIEEKDPYTGGHSERVADYSAEVARIVGFTEAQIEILHFATILHDVGKIGIPESIIHAPRPLTPEEFEVIKEHPMKGVHILRHIPFIKDHMHVIRNHHERWDGRGYPDGLAGDAISLEAQIVSVADTYDAMTSTRPYRSGMPPARAAEEIQRSTGTQFAKRIVEAFMEYYRGAH